MSRKILISGLSILASLGIVTAATYAYFNDTAASTGNTFSTGTVDLVLSDSDQTDLQNVTASFGSGTLLAPGTCLPSQTLNLKNTGTILANHVDVTVTNDNNTMAQYLRLDALSYDGGDLLPSLTSTNGTSIKDLQDLAASSVLVNKPLTLVGTNYPLTMTVCLDGSAPNAVQGLSNVMGLSILLDQGPH